MCICIAIIFAQNLGSAKAQRETTCFGSRPPWVWTSDWDVSVAPRSEKEAASEDRMGLDCQKNPRAHKNQIGTPLPPQTQHITPPKRGILWTWKCSCRKNAEILGAHKIGAAISGPRIADTNFLRTRGFFKDWECLGPSAPTNYLLHPLSCLIALDRRARNS